MAFQMVRSFFGKRSPSRSRVHEPIIDSESFGNQGGTAPYDIKDVGKSANSNWFELARHNKEASELGRKPHRNIGIKGQRRTLNCQFVDPEPPGPIWSPTQSCEAVTLKYTHVRSYM